MQNTAARERCAGPAAPRRDLWQSVPLELMLSGLFVLLAAGLKLAGILP